MHDNDSSNLEGMNLRDFSSRFTISSRGKRRNKLYCNQKRNYITIFYLKNYSCREGNKYDEYCKYSLIKFKP